MNGLSLCSGIGGIDLGLRHAVPDYQTVCYVELDPACHNVLLARMADGVLDRAPIWGDLKRFEPGPWRGLVDLVHGGYPCQPFSTAGRRRGTDDPRHLWPHIARIVDAVGPRWCLFENVAGHLSLGATHVVGGLVEMGFRVALGLFAASELGAPHERERLFLLAHRDGHTRPSIQRRLPDAGRPRRGRAGVQPSPEMRQEEAVGTVDRSVGYPRTWPPTPADPAWRDIVAVDARLAPSIPGNTGPQLNPTFVEWLMGFPRDWTDGLSRRARLRLLGNAVVPAMAALAWAELSTAASPSRGCS